MELKKSALATPKGPCTLMDSPGHRDFIRNTIRGIAQTDVGVIVLPVDYYQAALDRGDRRVGRDIGNSRLHMLLLSIQGVKQFVILVNRMDLVNYEQTKFEEAKAAMTTCLAACGLKPENVPILPVSGWTGDNITDVSSQMPWWKGQTVENPISNQSMTVRCLKEAIEDFAVVPPRSDGELLVPISGVFKIRGVGTVATGRVEQGTCKPGVGAYVGDETCTIFSIETHNVTRTEVKAGDICGFNLKNGQTKPVIGDLLALAPNPPAVAFRAQVQVCGNFNYKVGYETLCIVRTAIVPCKITAIAWSQSGEAKESKTSNPAELKPKDRGEITLKCSAPIPVMSFDRCQGLGRLTLLAQDNTVDMIGKVTAIIEEQSAKKRREQKGRR